MNFADIMKSPVEKVDKPSFKVEMIHYSMLTSSEKNFYGLRDIEKLADLIQLDGCVLQNLEVRKISPNNYEVVAGHRRLMACKLLVEEREQKEFAFLPCHVRNKSELLTEISLITTNYGQRERTSFEQMKEVQKLEELICALKDGSLEERAAYEQYTGLSADDTLTARKAREVIAEKLGISQTKVAQLKSINNNLVPEGKEKFESGEVKFSAAAELAGMDEESQRELIDRNASLAEIKREKMSVSESNTEETEEGDRKDEPLSAYGTAKRVYPEGSLIATNGCDGGHDCYHCAMDCEIRQEDRHCRQAGCGNPFPCLTMNVLENIREEIGSKCQFINLDLADMTAGSHEPTPCCKNCTESSLCGYACKYSSKQPTVPETIAEVEVVESEIEPSAPVEIESYNRNILENMIRREQEAFDQMKNRWAENQPWTYTKYAMMLEAFRNFMELHDQMEAEEQKDEPIQPELPILRNNDQRKEWLDTFRNWPVWFEVPEADEVYYRYDFREGSSFVVCEYKQWLEWRAKWNDGNPEATGTTEYILPKAGYHHLYDCRSNRSAMVEHLKEVQKKGW